MASGDHIVGCDALARRLRGRGGVSFGRPLRHLADLLVWEVMHQPSKGAGSRSGGSGRRTPSNNGQRPSGRVREGRPDRPDGVLFGFRISRVEQVRRSLSVAGFNGLRVGHQGVQGEGFQSRLVRGPEQARQRRERPSSPNCHSG